MSDTSPFGFGRFVPGFDFLQNLAKGSAAGMPSMSHWVAPTVSVEELEKRIHRAFPDALVKVKPMQRNAIETDASKSDKAIMARIIEEMFEEADMWLVADF